LALGERQAGLLLDPWQRLFRVDVGPRQRAVAEPLYPFGNNLLSSVQAGEEDAGFLANRVRDNSSFRELKLERRLNQLSRNFEQRDRERYQFIDGQAAVALVHRFS